MIKQYEYWEKSVYTDYLIKDSSEILTKCSFTCHPSNRYNHDGEGLDDKDLVISKLLRQDIQKYKRLFPHVSAAIQSRKYPLKGDTVQYMYTDSKHNNLPCRVISIENIKSLSPYDKEKYKK